MKNTIIAITISTLFSVPAFAGKPDFPNDHDNRAVKTGKEKSSSSSKSESLATASSLSLSRSKSNASANSSANGGNGTGGNADAAGGLANATGGQVIVSTGSGSGSGLTGRMVPDVSSGAPITSTSCRNGISAGGSGNGWGGLLGFFSEDDLCEWRLLEANYRATGDVDKANAIRSGMTLQRCEKLAPKERAMFGDLCPKQPAAEQPSVAFSSVG